MLTLTTGKRKWSEAKLEENCEFRRTDNVQGQISQHIFAPNFIFEAETPKDIKELAKTLITTFLFVETKIASFFLQNSSNTRRVFYLKSAIDSWLIIPLFIYLLM